MKAGVLVPINQYIDISKSMRIFLTSVVICAALPAFATSVAPLFISKNLQQNGLNIFFEKAEKLLPEKIRETLTDSVQVEFKEFESEGVVSSIVSRCSQNSKAGKHGHADEPRALAGYIQKKNILAGSYKIILNKGLLAEILKGEKNSTTISCWQKNMYTYALATLIHELAHIYDYTLKITPHQQKIKLDCESGDRNYRNLPNCRLQQIRKGALSESPQFLNLGHWQSRNSSINIKTSGKPDIYESQNAWEFFAVNFENFILDPEYKCRRPALYEFYRQHFGQLPITEAHCQINPVIYEGTTGLPITLDSSKIHSVRFVVSNPGQGWMSKFGHAYLLLVVCAPEQTRINDTCLKDKTHHIVVDFSAKVDTNDVNYFTGVFGGYFSSLNVSKLASTLNKATYDENRSLLSYPLNLSHKQIQILINKLLETYWDYTSEYFFINNNCAHELARVLLSLLPSDHKAHNPNHYMQLVNSPQTLRKGLIYADLIGFDSSAMVYKAIGEIRSASFKNLIRAAGNLLQDITTSDQYIEKASAPLRRQVIKKLQQEKKHDIVIWSSVYILEQAIYHAVHKKTLANVYKQLDKSEFVNYSDLVSRDMWFTPNNFINLKSTYTYGIPLKSEVIADSDVKSKWQASQNPRVQFLDKLWSKADLTELKETEVLLELAYASMIKK